MSKKTQATVLVIVASVRPVRRADEVLDWWLLATTPMAAAVGARLVVADLRDIELPMDDEPEEPQTGRYVQEHTRRWSRMVAGADAFVVITSEHNNSMPASLKNAFDHLGTEWADKPVAWVSYGNTSAGTRALVAAKQVATTLRMASVATDVSLRLTEWADGPVRPDPSRSQLAADSLERLVTYARALRPLRATPVTIDGLAPGLVASVAGPDDATELLVLQRCCWVDEAVSNDTLAIAALHDGLDEVSAAIAERRVIVVRLGGRLVASVQAWQQQDDWHLGRLMVAPDLRRRGVARALLRHMAAQRPETARRIVLSTGSRSLANVAFYESEGFVTTATSPGVVKLTKAPGTQPGPLLHQLS